MITVGPTPKIESQGHRSRAMFAARVRVSRDGNAVSLTSVLDYGSLFSSLVTMAKIEMVLVDVNSVIYVRNF